MRWIEELEFDHERQMVGGYVRVREADNAIVSNPVHVERAEQADGAQQVAREEHVVDHALEVVARQTRHLI